MEAGAPADEKAEAELTLLIRAGNYMQPCRSGFDLANVRCAWLPSVRRSVRLGGLELRKESR
jgi:hypothetical protein